MGLIEPTVPGAAADLMIDPCARCRREEGVWSVPWPDISENEFYLLCGHCLWRKFNEIPRGAVRSALVRRVFGRRIIPENHR
ncbi:MAG: hypothetical protein ACREQN_16455 [Candidatus Binataceae bacterium]